MFSKVLRQRIRDTLIDESTHNENMLTDKHVMPIIADVQDKLSKSGDVIEQSLIVNLEVVLETLTQIRVKNEILFLPQLLNIITKLSSKSSDQNVFYLIELSV